MALQLQLDVEADYQIKKQLAEASRLQASAPAVVRVVVRLVAGSH
jgi:hypothetical protein